VYGDGRTGRRRRAGLRLAHAGERQGAERRETASSNTRAAQKGAAIETFIRLVCEGDERAVMLFAFGSPDQHSCLLQLG
jgi:hypothetical protein